MDLPTELNHKILLKLPITELENICLSSTKGVSFCSDARFWEERFRKEDLPLPKVIPAVLPSWITEYKLTRIAQLREEYYMDSLLRNYIILLDLTKVNDVSILPDFLDKQEFAKIRTRRVLQKNISARPRKMLLLYRQGNIILDVGEGLQIPLTKEQAHLLLFIFCYYDLDPLTDRETKTYRVPRSQLEELGLVKPVEQWI
jgi:hypothetical protein